MKKLFFIASLFLSLETIAQHKTFSGRWAIDQDKSLLGQLPIDYLPKEIKISQQSDHVIIERTYVDDGKDRVIAETLAYDGKKCFTTSYSGKKWSSTFVWDNDQEKFAEQIITTTINGEPYLQATEICALNEDGAALVIDRYVEQSDGRKYLIKVYYLRTNQ